MKTKILKSTIYDSDNCPLEVEYRATQEFRERTDTLEGQPKEDEIIYVIEDIWTVGAKYDWRKDHDQKFITKSLEDYLHEDSLNFEND